MNFTDTGYHNKSDSSTEFEITLTVFVANATAEHGLSGIMGLAVSQESNSNYSVIR